MAAPATSGVDQVFRPGHSTFQRLSDPAKTAGDVLRQLDITGGTQSRTLVFDRNSTRRLAPSTPLSGIVLCIRSEQGTVEHQLDEDPEISQMNDALNPRKKRPSFANSERCNTCNASFANIGNILGVSRHHCRNCGKSFCDEHSRTYVALPSLGFSENDPQRVCAACLKKLEDAKTNTRFRQEIEGMPPHHSWAQRMVLLSELNKHACDCIKEEVNRACDQIREQQHTVHNKLFDLHTQLKTVKRADPEELASDDGVVVSRFTGLHNECEQLEDDVAASVISCREVLRLLSRCQDLPEPDLLEKNIQELKDLNQSFQSFAENQQLSHLKEFRAHPSPAGTARAESAEKTMYDGFGSPNLLTMKSLATKIATATCSLVTSAVGPVQQANAEWNKLKHIEDRIDAQREKLKKWTQEHRSHSVSSSSLSTEPSAEAAEMTLRVRVQELEKALQVATRSHNRETNEFRQRIEALQESLVEKTLSVRGLEDKLRSQEGVAQQLQKQLQQQQQRQQQQQGGDQAVASGRSLQAAAAAATARPAWDPCVEQHEAVVQQQREEIARLNQLMRDSGDAVQELHQRIEHLQRKLTEQETLSERALADADELRKYAAALKERSARLEDELAASPRDHMEASSSASHPDLHEFRSINRHLVEDKEALLQQVAFLNGEIDRLTAEGERRDQQQKEFLKREDKLIASLKQICKLAGQSDSVALERLGDTAVTAVRRRLESTPSGGAWDRGGQTASSAYGSGHRSGSGSSYPSGASASASYTPRTGTSGSWSGSGSAAIDAQYQQGLRDIKRMGFTDDEKILRALRRVNGVAADAVNILLSEA